MRTEVELFDVADDKAPKSSNDDDGQDGHPEDRLPGGTPSDNVPGHPESGRRLHEPKYHCGNEDAVVEVEGCLAMVEEYTSRSPEDDEAERHGGFDDAARDESPRKLLRVAARAGDQGQHLEDDGWELHCVLGLQELNGLASGSESSFG